MGLTIAKGTARGTIIDNDPPPRLSITASTAKEGDQNLGKVEFQLEMEAAAGTDITIDVGAENRTAVLGQDFLAPVTSITIPEGETQATISVEIIDDNVFEGGILESFDLVLSNPEPPIFAGEVRATGYIEDDEPRRQDVDYVGNTVDTTATIDVGMSWFNDNPVQGKVESEYDQDWYKTTLVENHCYQIEVRGKGHVDNGFARGLTLPDPFLRGLYTQYGNYIEGTQNNDGGSYLAALKTVKIDATSVIYISVMGGQEDDRGIFDLSVIDLGTVTETCTDIDPSVTDALQSTETDTPETVAEPVAEDLPENVTTIGYMNPNGLPAHGTIDAASDKDWFKVPLIAGFRYTIEMKGDVSSDYGGTLDDPLLYLRGQFGGQLPHNSLFIRSYNSDETLVVGDRDSGAGSNAKLRVRVNYTDMYFIQARSSNSTQGTYTVVVTRR